jgi:hypothetical protein
MGEKIKTVTGAAIRGGGVEEGTKNERVFYPEDGG